MPGRTCRPRLMPRESNTVVIVAVTTATGPITETESVREWRLLRPPRAGQEGYCCRPRRFRPLPGRSRKLILWRPRPRID